MAKISLQEILVEKYGTDVIAFTKTHPEFGVFSNFKGGVEQKFQAAKFSHNPEHQKLIMAATPAKAKYLGSSRCKKAKLSPGQCTIWNIERVNVMRALLREKFSEGTIYHTILVNTGNQTIVEKSPWDSKFSLPTSRLLSTTHLIIKLQAFGGVVARERERICWAKC